MKASWIFLAAGALSIIFFTHAVPAPAEKVVFLDIGQGDSILLQDDTQQMLIDGGPGMTVLSRLAEEMPWFDSTIEVVVATHPDRDHLEGLLHVIERYKVGLVLLPRYVHDSQLQREWLRQLLELLDENKTHYRFAYAGQQLDVGDIRMEMLWPDRVLAGGIEHIKKSNNASVVSRVDFHDMSFLMTADIEAPSERALIDATLAETLDVDVLKVGHHGSQTSTTPALLTATSPRMAVISAGADNRYGHPHEKVMENLGSIPIARTDEQGSVRYQFEGGKWLLAK